MEILDGPTDIETIAKGNGIEERARLNRAYGRGRRNRWRKLKGTARIRLEDGSVCMAELHWYEANGIGPQEFKIKYLL